MSATRTQGRALPRFFTAPVSLISCALAATAGSPCLASFTGFTVDNLGIVGGRAVFRVYANFSNPNNVLLSCLNHRVDWGSINALHNDHGEGTWSPMFTGTPDQVSNDSFVTISGRTGSMSSTSLDPLFGGGAGPEIASGAGWYNGNPGSPVVVGNSLRVMVMQIARAPGDSSAWSGRLSVGYVS